MSGRMPRGLCLACALLLLALAVFGCAQGGPVRYERTYLGPFDTVTTLTIYCADEASFEREAKMIYDELMELNALFDIYQDYEGVNNAKTINDAAGKAPVKVDSRLFDLLVRARELCALTGGAMDPTMGAVLKLWHDARTYGVEHPEEARLPDRDALAAAAGHSGFDALILDEGALTAYIADPLMSLDLGAIAKGYAAERITDLARARGVQSMLLSLGGNICAIGPKPDGSLWTVAIQDPFDPGANIGTIAFDTGTLVTSGAYQRYYEVDGHKYNHIIDFTSLMPAERFASVSVIGADSAMADALSTALFVLPYEEGRAILDRLDAGVVRGAVWVDLEGNVTTCGVELNAAG